MEDSILLVSGKLPRLQLFQQLGAHSFPFLLFSHRHRESLSTCFSLGKLLNIRSFGCSTFCCTCLFFWENKYHSLVLFKEGLVHQCWRGTNKPFYVIFYYLMALSFRTSKCKINSHLCSSILAESLPKMYRGVVESAGSGVIPLYQVV